MNSLAVAAEKQAQCFAAEPLYREYLDRRLILIFAVVVVFSTQVKLEVGWEVMFRSRSFSEERGIVMVSH